MKAFKLFMFYAIGIFIRERPPVYLVRLKRFTDRYPKFRGLVISLRNREDIAEVIYAYWIIREEFLPSDRVAIECHQFQIASIFYDYCKDTKQDICKVLDSQLFPGTTYFDKFAISSGNLIRYSIREPDPYVEAALLIACNVDDTLKLYPLSGRLDRVSLPDYIAELRKEIVRYPFDVKGFKTAMSGELTDFSMDLMKYEPSEINHLSSSQLNLAVLATFLLRIRMSRTDVAYYTSNTVPVKIKGLIKLYPN